MSFVIEPTRAFWSEQVYTLRDGKKLSESKYAFPYPSEWRSVLGHNLCIGVRRFQFNLRKKPDVRNICIRFNLYATETADLTRINGLRSDSIEINFDIGPDETIIDVIRKINEKLYRTFPIGTSEGAFYAKYDEITGTASFEAYQPTQDEMLNKPTNCRLQSIYISYITRPLAELLGLDDDAFNVLQSVNYEASQRKRLNGRPNTHVYDAYQYQLDWNSTTNKYDINSSVFAHGFAGYSFSNLYSGRTVRIRSNIASLSKNQTIGYANISFDPPKMYYIKGGENEFWVETIDDELDGPIPIENGNFAMEFIALAYQDKPNN